MGLIALAWSFFAVVATTVAVLPEEVEIVQLTITASTPDEGTYFCVFEAVDNEDGDNPVELARIKSKTKNEKVSWVITEDYDFDQLEYIRITIYNQQTVARPLIVTVCRLSTLLQETVPKELNGKMTIAAKNIGKRLNWFKLDASGQNLLGDEKKLNTLLVVSGVPEDAEGWEEAGRTDVKPRTKNPSWSTLVIPADLITSNSFPNRKILFQVFNEGKGTELGELVGEFSEELQKLKDAKKPATYDLLKLGGKKGELVIKKLAIGAEEYGPKEGSTISEYLPVIELACMNAIDFTGSNGDPKKPTKAGTMDGANSLHHLPDVDNPHNEYSYSLESVDEILQDFDSDQVFPTSQFGGKINGKYEVYTTNLKTKDGKDPFKAKGVLDVYRPATREITPYGNTQFAPLISQVIELAKPYEKNPLKFFTLLILTDGVIDDEQATIDQIVIASKYPISIIIVCVGGADFLQMKKLDGDGVILVHTNGTKAEDDIVQHVPIRKVIMKAKERGLDVLAEVRRKVLKEFPDQFVRYMKRKKLTPSALAKMQKTN